jgi:hypothetical protein
MDHKIAGPLNFSLNPRRERDRYFKIKIFHF